jgi:hypothetical protein
MSFKMVSTANRLAKFASIAGLRRVRGDATKWIIGEIHLRATQQL